MKVYVHSGQLLTTHGDLDATWSALLSAIQPSIRQQQGFNDAFPLAAIDELGGELGSAHRLNNLLEKLSASIPELPGNTALFVATTKAAIDEIFKRSPAGNGQVWQVCREIENRLNINRRGICVSAACASGSIALARGAMQIAAGKCDHALIVGFDLLSNFVLAGFAGLKALSLTGCKPFDTGRDGLALGEGAAWVLLTKDSSSFNDTTNRYILADSGISCDAVHITAPCRNGSGLIRTLRQILQNEKFTPGAINGHGTGTSYNDAMELLAFKTVWPNPVPLCSVKGSIGHCLGAAGVIESVISIKSLETGYLPPTAGLSTPEPDAGDKISGTEAIALDNPSIICCNSGFGGINCALLFKREV